MPKGAGPRLCPGRNLAPVEIKHLLETVARVESGRAVEERFNFVMMPVGLGIRLAPRAGPARRRPAGQVPYRTGEPNAFSAASAL